MILDSSAVVAILCRETGHLALLEKVIAADTLGMGTPTVFESAMVLTIKLRLDGLAMVNEFLRESGTQAISFTDQHASIAFGAFTTMPSPKRVWYRRPKRASNSAAQRVAGVRR